MICNGCGQVFEDEEVEIIKEYEEAWGRPAVIAEYGVCPFCGCESIEESAICECCEEEIAESKIINGVCEACEKKLCALEESA
jgi:hypothetical protein